MVAVYVRLIQRGMRKLEDVPLRIREDVEKALND